MCAWIVVAWVSWLALHVCLAHLAYRNGRPVHCTAVAEGERSPRPGWIHELVLVLLGSQPAAAMSCATQSCLWLEDCRQIGMWRSPSTECLIWSWFLWFQDMKLVPKEINKLASEWNWLYKNETELCSKDIKLISWNRLPNWGSVLRSRIVFASLLPEE